MKHGSAEKKRRAAAFKVFLKANPPKMPSDFSNKDYRRVVGYVRVAFNTGYNTGENDLKKELP